ncbi:MAG: hypothetical protein LBP65_00375 [Puniceicoccales bacterium]|jgi:hypothetical protein|nr:hypothetical protein [Puniceicoccales bacterium]
MQQFADQCLDLVQLILGQRVSFLEKVPGGEAWEDGAVAGALTAYIAQGKPQGSVGESFMEFAAQRIGSQFFYDGANAKGCSLAALALVDLGLNRSRNEVWKRLTPEMQNLIQDWMRTPLPDGGPEQKIYAIVQAVVAGAMGFVEKDGADGLMGNFLANSGGQGEFLDTATAGIGGRYDVSGLLLLILFREVLQRHANVHIRERRLPSLRTRVQKYLRLLPAIATADGESWSYGLPQGPLATISSCSLVAWALADGWIGAVERPEYVALLGRLFRHFFLHHINREEGCISGNLSVGEYFSVVRQLLICSYFGRLVRGSIGQTDGLCTASSGGRFFTFDRTARKEQGLWAYRSAVDGSVFQLPLVGGNGSGSCAYLAFPHRSGVIDGPVAGHCPVFVPSLSWEGVVTTPSFWGKDVASGMGDGREFQFRYEQPELTTPAEEIVPGIASCRVQWTFDDGWIRSEFFYIPRRTVRLDRFSYAIALLEDVAGGMAADHVELRPELLVNDFYGEWQPPRDVAQDPRMRTADGRQIRCLLCLERLLPIQLQQGRSYCFSIVLHLDRVAN